MGLQYKCAVTKASVLAIGVLGLCTYRVYAEDASNAAFVASRNVKTSLGGEVAGRPSSQTRDDAEPGLTIRNLKDQHVPYADVEKIYQTACSAVRREFGITTTVQPALTLVLGAKTDVLNYPAREIQLSKWDKYQFAQGVVLLAFEDLMPVEERMRLTAQAVSWADAVVNISNLKDTHAAKR